MGNSESSKGGEVNNDYETLKKNTNTTNNRAALEEGKILITEKIKNNVDFNTSSIEEEESDAIFDGDDTPGLPESLSIGASVTHGPSWQGEWDTSLKTANGPPETGTVVWRRITNHPTQYIVVWDNGAFDVFIYRHAVKGGRPGRHDIVPAGGSAGDSGVDLTLGGRRNRRRTVRRRRFRKNLRTRRARK